MDTQQEPKPGIGHDRGTCEELSEVSFHDMPVAKLAAYVVEHIAPYTPQVGNWIQNELHWSLDELTSIDLYAEILPMSVPDQAQYACYQAGDHMLVIVARGEEYHTQVFDQKWNRCELDAFMGIEKILEQYPRG